MGFGKAPGRRRQIKKYPLNLRPAYTYLLLPPAGHFRLAESGQRPVGKGGFRPSPLPDTHPPSNGQTQGDGDPNGAQRSGSIWERRSKRADRIFAARRKWRGADFTTTMAPLLEVPPGALLQPRLSAPAAYVVTPPVQRGRRSRPGEGCAARAGDVMPTRR